MPFAVVPARGSRGNAEVAAASERMETRVDVACILDYGGNQGRLLTWEKVSDSQPRRVFKCRRSWALIQANIHMCGHVESSSRGKTCSHHGTHVHKCEEPAGVS